MILSGGRLRIFYSLSLPDFNISYYKDLFLPQFDTSLSFFLEFEHFESNTINRIGSRFYK